MRDRRVIDLADCSDFRQTLEGRPPAIVHGSVLLLALLLGSAIAWGALTKADLVVRASGRVRPVDTPTKIFTAISSRLEGRVVEVHAEEGQQVGKGEMLIRLDTGALDNEIAKHRRTIEAADEELEKLRQTDALLGKQYQAAAHKAKAELAQAGESLRREHERQASQIRQAKSELMTARDGYARLRKAWEQRATTDAEVVEAHTKVRQAEENLRRSQIPLDKTQLRILQSALELVAREFAVKRAELETRQVAKLGEAEAARKELANLELELDKAVLRAPIDGIITQGQIKAGDVLEAGKPVLEIATQRGFRFEVPVASEDVGELRPGMPVKIKFDAYDYQKYGTLDGRVCFIAPDSRISEPAKGDAAIAAYLVKIELATDELGRGELRGRVKLGMAGVAEIVTARESLLSIFVRKIRRTISLG